MFDYCIRVVSNKTSLHLITPIQKVCI